MRGIVPWMAGVWVAVAAPAATAAAADYVVQPEDTLVRIARTRVGDERRWKELADINALQPPYALHLGQKLVLPAGWPATAPAGGAWAATRPTTAERPAEAPPGPLPAAQAFRASRRPASPAASGAAPAARPSDAGASPSPATPGWLHLPAFLGALSAVARGVVFVIGSLLWWVFFALCLRGACWFSLVATTLGACFRLSMYLVLLAAACGAVGMALPALGGTGVSVPAQLALGAVAVLAYFVVSLAVTRRVLDCQWRSVVTVLVMATFVWDLLVVGIVVGVIVLLGTAVLAG